MRKEKKGKKIVFGYRVEHIKDIYGPYDDMTTIVTW